MASIAERIAAGVHQALTVPPMTSVPVEVHRDLHGALEREAYPAIAIETGNEPPAVRSLLGHRERVVEVRVTVLAEGGYEAADPADCEAFARIAANPTIGGLAFDVEDAGVVRERAPGARQVFAVTRMYRFPYRTVENSLES